MTAAMVSTRSLDRTAGALAAIEAYVADDLDTENAFKTKDGRTIFATDEAREAASTYFKLFQQASPPSSVRA